MKTVCFGLLLLLALVGRADAGTFFQLALPAADVVWDPLRGRLYASVPTGEHADSVAVVDPQTGTVESFIAVGSRPNVLAISDDARYLYVGLLGEPVVVRVDLATRTVNLRIDLGREWLGPHYAEDLAVLPGMPGSIAVARQYRGISPGHAGIAIFDDDVVRAVTTPEWPPNNRILFGASPDRLYGVNIEDSDFGVTRMLVDSSGVSVQTHARDVGGASIAVAGGRVYTGKGAVLDGGTLATLDTLPVAGTVAVDASPLRAFFVAFVESAPALRIRAFDPVARMELASG
ncbi:MAG TPA: hypothetical protein VGM22_04620, partial [Methylomirabilota bacterium]